MERLRQGGLRLAAPSGEVEGWVEGFHEVQALRLRLQLERGDRCHSAHDRFDPRGLSPADRRRLKGALRQAASLRRRVLRAFGP